MIDQLLNTVMQLAVFTLIPFLTYLILRRTRKGFFDWIGLYRSNRKANQLALLVTLVLVAPMLLLSVLNPAFHDILAGPESLSGQMRAISSPTERALMILLIAIFKTALSEEILFRGLLAKRLIAWLGFRAGNIVQALIFGLIHTLLFASVTSDLLFLGVIFLAPTIGVFWMVYINEKIADGSIVPGWIAHAGANVLSYSYFGFLAA